MKSISLLSLGELGIIDIARFIDDIFLNNAEGLNFHKLVRDAFLFNKVISSILPLPLNYKVGFTFGIQKPNISHNLHYRLA